MTIDKLQAEIERLKAQLLDADQCAARALQGRDEMIARCTQLEKTTHIPPGYVSKTWALIHAEKAVKRALIESTLQASILRAQVRLLKLRAKL